MAKQDLKFTIEDVARLILSLETFGYCALEPDEENEKFEICDYYMSNGKCSIGNKFRITIYKDKVCIFFCPTLNISLPFNDKSEFHEILGLYFDFKEKVREFLVDELRRMITVKDKNRNPFLGHEVFMDNVMVNQNARPRRAAANNIEEFLADLHRQADELNLRDGAVANNVGAVDFEAAGINN